MAKKTRRMTGIVEQARALADYALPEEDANRYNSVDSAFSAIMGMYAAMTIDPTMARQVLTEETEGTRAQIIAELGAAAAVVGAVVEACRLFYIGEPDGVQDN